MNKVIVISGGSDGLGKKLAEGLTTDDKVVIISPSEEKLKNVADKLNCDYRVADISNPESVEKAIKSIASEYGRIDCLINNAGIWIQGELESNDYNRIKQVIEVNALGTIYLTKAAIPEMKRSKGLIINIISQAGINAKSERTVYNASKWAITGFTKSIQPELAPYGVRVTGLYPGMMKTEMFSKMGVEKDMANGVQTDEVLKAVEFLLSLDEDTMIPELGIKHINN